MHVFMNSDMKFRTDENRITVPENLHCERASVSVIQLNRTYLLFFLDTTRIQQLLFYFHPWLGIFILLYSEIQRCWKFFSFLFHGYTVNLLKYHNNKLSSTWCWTFVLCLLCRQITEMTSGFPFLKKWNTKIPLFALTAYIRK